ncbi:ergothioneine biosynthesis PLP-dependent enzyme EgtE [Mycobacterium sp. CBMA293]|uniref:ergothioneine biosynthesis PLP-dependent enzyme EgtE n=1 Tax=unclassified Mycolicibacterium TaxID=2636767 RepID=UPI0013213A50|nr:MULTISPECIES: ergothioneine biosynthesis PLP-dependent enzyme EgtE [unclassified Mycolicibacterium]MUL49282.1 ergothioneine biosynthesis PLP-dependent enzyme EgtE [Mycolicibacterium sp. CBMA 360]MUL94299.1 ergothioneine biosynthesis PLP-dependent enzyme EgtE [Mycolicibacterium sp. CBMA 230]MUM30760.1 ergothioneine biosynthesis PLP-dependent enzyme EgtE [Mycolicibacterium sp. CBMA 361]MUL58941.1 ergothioneine biosynthesis PLP-dependent enzyme EgtE [Mycolicibacterium sp. CBMA 335]MUL69335.1 e
MSEADPAVARLWRAARPKPLGLHFDNAACSRQSFAVIDAAAGHARLEAQVGGYVAAESAEPVLAAGRSAVATLTGMAAGDVVFTTGSANALNLLLSSWDDEKTVACLPGEYGPNLVVMEANGFTVRHLPVDDQGRLDVEVAAAVMKGDPPALAHLTALGSHSGVAQPLAEFIEVCRAIGVPVAVDAAQALGHLDCDVAPDVIYASSRKWLAGPRGVGVLAISSSVSHRLRPRIPLPEWGAPLPVLRRLDLGESNVAARVAFSLALEEHLVAGPEVVRARLADVGRLTRTVLATLPGWRVVENVDEPTAITTLEPTRGADPNAVRARLIADHSIVTTVAGVDRAPFEMKNPVLRVSPHVDVTSEELESFAGALTAASA